MDLDGDARRALLETECHGDAELRREVESLLGHAAPARSFLEASPIDERPAPGIATPGELGPYRLAGRLGRGGHGSVHLAEHRDGGRVALKTVAESSPPLVEAIRREIHTLARMRHPGVVRILDHGIDDGLPWYAMELVEGVTLHELAGRGGDDVATASLDAAARGVTAPAAGGPATPAGAPRMELVRALSLVHALCDPLGHVHGAGIVHRDLKPGNVMVRPDGSPVIVDFGVAARFVAGLSREVMDLEGAIVGTVLYMAPEQIRGELVDARADIYSLGCILHELVTGRPPFVADEAAAVLRMHLDAPPPAASAVVAGVPPALDRLLARLLGKTPRDRPGYAADVALELEEILGDAAPAAPPAVARQRAYLYRPRMVGREEILEELRGLTRQLRAGRGALVLLGGESGIGKTRLAMELGRLAMKAQHLVLMGECQRLSGTEGPGALVPLQPLLRPLQHVADRCRDHGDAAEVLGEGGPMLALYEPALGTLPGMLARREESAIPPATARRRLFSHLRETFRALGKSSPVLLVLDDLQWADDLSLGFLEHLADGAISGLPLLVVGTYRSEESSPRLAELARRESVRRMMLPRLPEEAVRAMVSDMLAMADPDPALATRLSLEGAGNPFFVAEFLRAAVQDRWLGRDREGRFRVSEDAELSAQPALPSSLQELIAARLATLSPPALRLAKAGAVLGSGGDEALMLQVAGLPEGDGYAALEELIARQVVEELDDGRLRFGHDRIRQVVYGNLGEEERIALHRASAELLEGSTDREVRSAGIGLHWERAGRPERARECYLTAAARSAERYALRESAAQYRAFLGLSSGASASAVSARIALGHRVLGPLGQRAEAVVELERALGDSRELGLPDLESSACRTLAHWCHATGDAARARDLYARAIAVAGAQGDRENERRALEQAGTFHQQQGEMERARELYERALALHRAAGDRKHEASALSNLATLRHQQRRLDEARALYHEAVSAFRLLRDRRLEGDVLVNLGALELELGELELAEGFLREALEIARRSAHRGAELLALGNLAICRSLQGDLPGARALHLDALRIADELGDAVGQGNARLGVAEILAEERSWDEALAACDRVMGDPRLASDGRLQGAIRCLRASVLRRAGRELDEAEALLSDAAAIFEELDDALELAKCRCHQGQLELARGRGVEATLEGVRAVARQLGVTASSELGRLVAQLGRSAAARKGDGGA